MKKILIVEDDRLISSVVKIYIRDTNFEIVGICQSGEEAVKESRSKKPDLIVMDINLDGEISGFEAASQIKEFSSCKVIFISGDNNIHHNNKSGFSDAPFLRKPIKKIEFNQVVSALFEMAG